MNGWLPRALALTFLVMAPVQAVRPMVTYQALAFGADPAQVGWIAGSYAALSFLMAVPLGRWIDRHGVPMFLVAGTALVTATAAAIVASGSLATLAVAQALIGLGQVAALMSIQTLLSNGSEPTRRDGRIAMFTVMGSLGQMTGPAAAGWLFAATDDLDTVFLTSAVAAGVGLALAVTLLLRPAPRSAVKRGADRPQQAPLRQEAAGVLRTPSVPHAMFTSMTVLTSIDLVIAYLPAYGEARGIAPETIGLVLGAQAAGALVSRLLMTRLLLWLGRKRLLVASMALPATMLCLLPSTASPVVLFVLMVTAGFGLGLGQPLSLSWVVSQVPEVVRGTAIGLRLTANRFSQFALPIVVGGLVGGAGVAAIFVVTGALLGGSAGVMSRASMTADA